MSFYTYIYIYIFTASVVKRARMLINSIGPSWEGFGWTIGTILVPSGAWQTGQSTGQSAGPSTSQSTPASGVTFAMPPGFLDTSSGPGGGPGGVPVGVPVSQDPLMMQVLRQQMLLTQSMVDFLVTYSAGSRCSPSTAWSSRVSAPSSGPRKSRTRK